MMVVWRLLFVIGLPALAQSWVPVESGTTANLRGVSVNGNSVWVSGDKGTVLRRSVVGGAWLSVSPKGVADLDFRDIEAVDERTAFLMSSGEGPQSRIYKTTDGGATWALLMTNLEPKGFWDCMSFWDPTHGIIIGDPVDGRFTILTTSDGATWQKLKGPSANKEEGAFAASGSCVFTRGTREAWFGTGGVGGARVFHTEDGGKSWSVAKTPIRHDSASAGIFSVAFSDPLRGVIVGGDFMKPDEPVGNVAITQDGGKTWTTPVGAGPRGYRSAVLANGKNLTATGPSGTDESADRGQTWTKAAIEGYNAITWGWVVGSNGRISMVLVGVLL
jgi:photosystem II stability/assembly factor-like uncharacterized protein